MGGRNIAPPHRRCDATCRDGHTCQSWRMRGQRRCRMHGGSSPQARRNAKQRLALHDAATSLRQVVEREQRILRSLEKDQ
jgi:hypothetical protein